MTVINATGVILHTNLGRAPLSAAALQGLSAVSCSYANLEYDLKAGRRWHRDQIIEPALQRVIGCESATAVNNNAASVFLILNTFASGRDVVVSRGELIEIGGSFRIPEIMQRSGARLVEAGSTNKTYVSDFEAAIGPATALLLRVHPSNYRIRGSTTRPSLSEMVALARRHGIPLVEDIGSGCLVDLTPFGMADEPRVQESLAAGVDLVCFSADKLLGGPQAGIIAGTRSLIEKVRSNPLLRAFRLDKLAYAALEATLLSYQSESAWLQIPVLRMISMTTAEIEVRSRRFADRLRTQLPESVRLELIGGHSVVGGGSCPDAPLPTVLISFGFDSHSPNEIELELRSQIPPVLVRIENDHVLVDLRTVFPEQESLIIEALIRILR